MITERHTDAEIIAILNDNTPFLLHQVETFGKAYNKAIIKAKPRQAYRFKPIEIKHKNGVTYYVVFYNETYDDFKAFGACYALYAVILRPGGFSAYFSVDKKINKFDWVIYTSHFFDRYAQRVLCCEPCLKKELIHEFFKENKRSFIQPQNDSRYKNGIFVTGRNYIGFGVDDDGIKTIKTCINADMMHESQVQKNDFGETKLMMYETLIDDL